MVQSDDLYNYVIYYVLLYVLLHVSLCVSVSLYAYYCFPVCVISLGKKMTRQEDQEHIFNFVWPCKVHEGFLKIKQMY